MRATTCTLCGPPPKLGDGLKDDHVAGLLQRQHRRIHLGEEHIRIVTIIITISIRIRGQLGSREIGWWWLRISPAGQHGARISFVHVLCKLQSALRETVFSISKLEPFDAQKSAGQVDQLKARWAAREIGGLRWVG